MEESFSSLERLSKVRYYDVGIIYLRHKTPERINKVIVLTEGSDDKAIYNKFFSNDYVDIQPCIGCRQVVKELYKQRKTDGKDDVIAILDSDFRNLNKSRRKNSYIFYSDCHDMEITILAKTDIMKTLLWSLHINFKGIKSNSLFKKIEEELFVLSMSKWFNIRGHYNFKISNLGLQPKSTINRKLAIADLLPGIKPGKTCKYTAFPVAKFESFINNSPKPDLDQITNGHDFLARLAVELKYNYSHQSCEDTLRAKINELFTSNMAHNTDLYTDIKKWADRRSLKLMA